MPCLLTVESFLISSDLIALQLLLEIAHSIPLSPQSVSSHLIPSHPNSSHLTFLNFCHVISSHPISCLLSLSQLFSAHHNCSHLLSLPRSFPHLFESKLIFSQLFTFCALPSSCQLTLCLLMFSILFSHLPSSSHVSSPDLSSC